MQITPLGSGSQGNSLLVRTDRQAILVDIGVVVEDLEDRLARVGVAPASITAICVTHRHKDHIRGVAGFCRKYRTPVHATARTLRSLCNKLERRLHPVRAGRPFRIGDVEAVALPLEHDAPDTVAFRFDDGSHRFGIATDLGSDNGSLRDAFSGLDALLLEFNHDSEMLTSGPYPRQLRDRVASDRGHLSNVQAAALLATLDRSRLRHLWIGHISQHTNRPELATAAARQVLGADYRGGLSIAAQDGPSDTLDLAQDLEPSSESDIHRGGSLRDRVTAAD